MSPSRQIPLQFPEAELGFVDMAITGANRAICAAIRTVERWPDHVFCLSGAARSGLTTLALAWCAERAATYLSAAEFEATSARAIEDLASADLAIDDVAQLTQADNLLILMSAMRRHGKNLLLAAHAVPSNWKLQSPDLNSRLKAAPLAEIPPPDEELMRERLKRAFARSVLKLPKSVEDYLVTRLGLDYSLIEHSAEILAGASGERPLTIPLAREIFGEEET